MSAFPETSAAWKKLKFNFRAMICEEAIAFAYWICQKGYTPSPSELLADHVRASIKSAKSEADAINEFLRLAEAK